LSVGHAYSTPIRWDCAVEVFGTHVEPGMLIHADKHGFLAVPGEETPQLLDAARAMDTFECQTMIAAARSCTGKSTPEILKDLDAACDEFGRLVGEKFSSENK
jgi:4-hydroxy-4-methyl-2-oxoglutarate aldolase